MKITKIETFQIETPRYYGHISGHVIVKVHVDDGPVGSGKPPTAEQKIWTQSPNATMIYSSDVMPPVSPKSTSFYGHRISVAQFPIYTSLPLLISHFMT